VKVTNGWGKSTIPVRLFGDLEIYCHREKAMMFFSSTTYRPASVRAAINTVE
jgi:hypothetical protein